MLDGALTMGEDRAKDIMWVSQYELEKIRLFYLIDEMVRGMSFNFEERAARLAKEQFETMLRFEKHVAKKIPLWQTKIQD